MRGEGRREPRKAAALQDWDEDAVVSKECSRLATRIVPPKAKAKREQRHPVQLRILILMAKMMMGRKGSTNCALLLQFAVRLLSNGVSIERP